MIKPTTYMSPWKQIGGLFITKFGFFNQLLHVLVILHLHNTLQVVSALRQTLKKNRITVKPVTNGQPLGPEKAVFSGRWSSVRGLHRTIMNVRPSMPGEVVFSTRLVASHGDL